MIRKKQITIIKTRTKSWYKNQIKSNSKGWNWKKNKKKIYINKKFEYQI